MNWWQLESAEIISQLNSSESGLSPAAARKLLEEVGPNQLQEKKRKSALSIFLNQFKDFMILVLLAAAVVAGIVGDVTDTIIIAVIILLNAIVGFLQENKAEEAMEALKRISALQAHVLRDGNSIVIPAEEIVPGDIVIVEAGAIIPADMRLLETYALTINESALTGESVPVEKESKPFPEKELPIGDRLNMAYKSTIVTNGRGKGLVVATGMQTEIGSIAKMLQQNEEATPLQKRMADFGRRLSYLVLLICGLFFLVGYLRGSDIMTLLLTSISLAVAAIPEALPALITVALARGAKRLARKNALIRKLSAVETLGSVTFICSDKTGTLTQNKMKVVQVESSGLDQVGEMQPLMLGIALNQDTKQIGNALGGDPTEIAMVEYFQDAYSRETLQEVRSRYPRIAEVPFDSERKCMTTAHRFNEQYLIVSKGAVESIVSALRDRTASRSILDKANHVAHDGIRVIGFGYRIMKKLPNPFTSEEVERDLVFAGFVGLIDPPREEARVAIAECKTAGIKPVMITGDHPATARSIAQQLGILSERELAVSGRELADMPESEFDEIVEEIRVYARVSPQQKLKIVQALQRKSNFVAMTGDGVNDAPALKAANIGVAMGITGTDVSKESSDMVLLDDNFATIVKAVKEGRHIYDNIRKFVKYIMTCNSAEIWTMFLAPIFGLPIPLLALHILWINLVTDGLPGLALSYEKEEKDIMNRPPRDTNESLFSDGMGYHIAWVGLLMAIVTLGLQAWAVNANVDHWQTMVFTVLAFSQLSHVMAIRSDREFLHKLGLFSNRPLLGAVLLTIGLQLAVIYVPAANTIFRTHPLTPSELLLCFGLSMIVLVGVEVEKFFKRNLTRSN
jgi:P-type Ca2+ transporter type 2C